MHTLPDRLGISRLRQIEPGRLSLKFLKPDVYYDAVGKGEPAQKIPGRPLSEIVDKLRTI